MADFTIHASDFLEMLTETSGDAIKNAAKKLEDSVDDLARIATQIAPIEESDLRRSGHAKVRKREDELIGEVRFSAVERDGGGRFNYAQWIHEMDYQLGPLSAGAGGTDGYTVGNKYLERPLEGEAEKYINWMKEGVRDALS